MAKDVMILRVIISAGGTGGHIYPALAIISKIKQREPHSDFLYIGTHNRMEKDIIPKHSIPFESIEIYGFNRKNVFKNVKTVQSFIKSYRKCKRLIKNFKPDIVIGVGGYVTGPVVYAASRLGYKTMIHEQNSVPGKCNLFLSKHVDFIATSFQSSNSYFPSYKTIFTGNPCGESALTVPIIEKSSLGLSVSKKLVLIVMGSLGSDKMSRSFTEMMPLFQKKNYEVLFVTGNSSYEEVSKHSFPSNVKVVPYIESLARVMKVTDLMISRAGASTLSELINLQVPSILIPSPYVPDNHQFKNAMDLVNRGASVLVEEKDLEQKKLVALIDELLTDEERISKMKQNLKDMSILDSASLIYDQIQKLIGRDHYE